MTSKPKAKRKTPAKKADTATDRLAELTEACREAILAVREADVSNVEASRLAGDLLNGVKAAMKGKGKGAFGEHVEKNLPKMSPSWRARIMNLAKDWNGINQVYAGHLASGEPEPEYTVNNLMKLWRASKRLKHPDDIQKPKPKRKSAAEYEALLAEKDARIKELESELNKVRARRAKAA